MAEFQQHQVSEGISFRGVLKGHEGWVTSIACLPDNPNMIVSSSRDKTVMVWHLTHSGDSDKCGFPRRALKGHSHFVQDVVVSSDGNYCLSGSWDQTLRLWDIKTGKSTKRFVGHTKDVLSVAFSPDNRQIVSCGRDKSIKLWNTLGECKYTITEDQHTEWASCVRFTPSGNEPLIVSGGWDKLVKVWRMKDCKLQSNLVGHTGFISCITVSPDGSLCASGGHDGFALLWDLHEGKKLYKLEAGNTIHSLCFSPNRYWLCAAAGNEIKVWDLETKNVLCTLTLDLDGDDVARGKNYKPPHCTCLTWSNDGATLFAGCTDNLIRVFSVN